MLWRSSKLIGYGVQAKDGTIGSVVDLLFDDTDWSLRWAVIDTGTWLSGRQVLLAPEALGTPDASTRQLPVDVTRKAVENSPGIARDEPVSRQLQKQLYAHYGWAATAYPGFVPAFGAPLPAPMAMADRGAQHAPHGPDETAEESGDPHLRSVSEVTGYYIRATDDDIGHVEEMLVEDGTWAIRYLVVDTKNWWPGRKVLVASQSFNDIDWHNRRIHVDLTREAVKGSPEYNPDHVVDRGYEQRLHAHYGLAHYWP